MLKNRCSGADCVSVTVYEDGSVDLYSTRRPRQAVVIDADEWIKFVEEVRAGEWDHTLRPDRMAHLGGVR